MVSVESVYRLRTVFPAEVAVLLAAKGYDVVGWQNVRIVEDGAPMNCRAASHNATEFRAKRCRCERGREAHNADQRRARKERELGRPRFVPAAPIQRQVRDLMAAGWPAREIASRIGWHSGELHDLLIKRRFVRRVTAERIAVVYEALHAIAGPSEITRRRAARKDLSYKAIARRMHVHQRQVARDLRALGLARPQSVDAGVNADRMTHAEHMSNHNASGVA